MLRILSLAFVLIVFSQVVNAQTTHPTWSAQSNIYEVNLRQYSNAGSFAEFEKHLPRLSNMGVNILWFMPITPIGKEGRKMTESELGSYYAVQDYKGVNPEFGSLDEWKKLVKLSHLMGFKVIIDWVANHSAIDNHWVKSHPNFYVHDKAGKNVSPYDWTDVYKLNYADRELRDSMIDAMQFWIKETNIDGFRCDVAEDVPVDFWKECIAKLRKTKNVFMLAEGEKANLHEAGFDETYTWDMMREMQDLYSGKHNIKQFDSTLNAGMKKFPANAYRLYFTTNHDENSWNGTEFEKYGDAYKAFAILTQTMYQSVPLIYNGQENPNKHRLKFFVKDTISWGEGFMMAPFYKILLDLRKSNPALAANASYHRLATNNQNVFAYVRQNGKHKVVVVLNFSSSLQLVKIKDKAQSGKPFDIFSKVNEPVNPNRNIALDPWGYVVYDYK
jgi:glycosidase